MTFTFQNLNEEKKNKRPKNINIFKGILYPTFDLMFFSTFPIISPCSMFFSVFLFSFLNVQKPHQCDENEFKYQLN